jgi:hypothetical protein
MQEDSDFRFQFLCAATDEDYDAITRELPTGADIELDSGLTGLSVLKVALGSALLHKLADRAFAILCREDSIREIKVQGPNLKIEVRDIRARDLTLLVNFVKAIGVRKERSTQ